MDFSRHMEGLEQQKFGKKMQLSKLKSMRKRHKKETYNLDLGLDWCNEARILLDLAAKWYSAKIIWKYFIKKGKRTECIENQLVFVFW